MKHYNLIKYVFAAFLISILLLGCKSAMEALRMSGALGKKKQAEKIEPPKFYGVDHSSHSDLPTVIDFFSDSELNKDNFSDWALKEMKVDLRYVQSFETSESQYHHYQQYHDDLPIAGAEYNFLMIDGKPVSAHGQLYSDIKKLSRASISKDEVLRRLIPKYPDWQIRKTNQEWIIPLMKSGKTEMHLSYLFQARNQDSQELYDIFVESSKGEILSIESMEIDLATGSGVNTDGETVSLESQHTNDIPEANAEVYNDNKEQGYRLFDIQRNLHTLTTIAKRELDVDMDEALEGGLLDAFSEVPEYKARGHEIIEKDNIWEDSGQAVDVHWGMQVSYDYFLSNHGRKGFDGHNGYLPALIEYGRTAFSRKEYLMFSDGSDKSGIIRPVTTLDVVAHEYTHAVTHSIANLSTNGEAGIIHESISDIFAATIELSVGKGDWVIAKEVSPSRARSLKDPNSTSQPDTYEGKQWMNFLPRDSDKKDPAKHYNTGVMNHWYYLLCQGGKDQNDNEDHYDIKPIGMQKAADLVYKTLFRIHRNIDIEGFRQQNIALAKKLYGKCSEELKNVTNAWNAVGVGDPFCDCFKGSYVLVVEDGKQTNRATFYYKDDKSAVEILDKDGIPRRVVTSTGDQYRHVQGYPDLPASGPSGILLKQMFQGKNIVLTNPPIPYVSRKAYVEKRNKLRTGRKMEVSGYTAFEYKVPDGTFWSTDEVCTALIDMSRLYAHLGPTTKKNNFRAFYGFPVKMTVDGESYWIENIKEYDVPDHIFSR